MAFHPTDMVIHAGSAKGESILASPHPNPLPEGDGTNLENLPCRSRRKPNGCLKWPHFSNKSPLEGVIGGRNVAAAHGELLETRDPGSGQRLADVSAMQAEDIDRAVQAAEQAFRETAWARMPPNERGALLHRLADAIEEAEKDRRSDRSAGRG